MTQALFMVQAPINDGSTPLIDGITCVIVNAVSTSTATQARAAAVTALVTAGHDVPDSYFDAGPTPATLSDLSGGPLKDAADAFIFANRHVEQVGA